MSFNSYEEDIEKLAFDYRIAGQVLEDRFRPESIAARRSPQPAGADAILMRARRAHMREQLKARRAEMEARRLEDRTRQLMKDLQLWRWETRDVTPLSRR